MISSSTNYPEEKYSSLPMIHIIIENFQQTYSWKIVYHFCNYLKAPNEIGKKIMFT